MTATDPTRRQRFVRWSKTLPKKLGLLALAVALTLLALEGVFRLLGYRPLYNVYSRPQAFWQHDRQLGWSLRPKARGEFVGPRPFPIEFRFHIRVNSLGFRGPETTPLPPGGHHVLVLGDSYAAGFEVAENRR